MTDKKCAKCKQVKDVSEFTRQSNLKDGLASYCRECFKPYKKSVTPEKQRIARLKHKYGVTPDFVKELLESQNNICAICGTSDWGYQGPHIDHDHTTGNIRGILCHNCNTGLGYFGDDTTKLLSALRYINASKKKLIPLPQPKMF